MGKVKVYINDNQKSVKLPSGTRMLVRKACTATLKVENFIEDAEVNVTFVDKKEIHELNLEFRSKDAPTDVLSFPGYEPEDIDVVKNMDDLMVMGDIIISKEKVIEQAEEYGNTFEREFAYLLVHGILHLLGYDHMEEDEKAIMRDKEEEILGALNLSR